MTIETDPIVASVHRLVSEELHLIGQEVEDSLPPGQGRRLADLATTLDELHLLLRERRTGPAVTHRIRGIEEGT